MRDSRHEAALDIAIAELRAIRSCCVDVEAVKTANRAIHKIIALVPEAKPAADLWEDDWQ